MTSLFKTVSAIRPNVKDSGKRTVALALLIAAFCIIGIQQKSIATTNDGINTVQTNSSECPAPENGLGAIEGRIMGSLLPLKGVKVVLLRNEEVVDETVSDEEGYYRFPLLSPGRYNMKGKKEGHRVSITTEIPVASDLITKVDFYLPKMDDDNRSKFPIVETYEYKSNITGFKRIPQKQ